MLLRTFFVLAICWLPFFEARAIYVQPPAENGIKFIENKGQWEPEVLFKADIPGGALYITPTALVYSFWNKEQIHDFQHGTGNGLIDAHAYKVRINGIGSSPTIQTGTPYSESYNYFLGNNTAKWASNCKAYDRVLLVNAKTGIAVELIGKADYVKINFILQPNANPSQLELVYEGVDSLEMRNQSLFLTTTVNRVKEEAPIALQANDTIVCAYQLLQNKLTFNLGKYNQSRVLVIDPNVIFGTYSGSTADNFGNTATFDQLGNAWTGGTVYATGFPVTVGAYQLNFAGGSNSNGTARDIGLLKFSNDGRQLLSATYLGGTNNEQPHSLICDGSGNLLMMGTTYSTNFPVTANVADGTFNGRADIVVCKLSSNGQQLIASTFWGGSDDDGINSASVQNAYSPQFPICYNYGDAYRGEIVLDVQGNVCIASCTQSANNESFQLVNAFQPTFGGGEQDGCIFKFTPNLQSIILSSYLGGNQLDMAYSLRFDFANNIVVGGGTTSTNMGVSQGALNYNGGVDGFIARIDNNFTLTKLVYLGTSDYDQIYFLDQDVNRNVYVTGQTLGAFINKGNAYTMPATHQFICILNEFLDTIQYSSTFGSYTAVDRVNISLSSFMVDDCGRIYVSGWGGQVNNGFNAATGVTDGLPLTDNGFQLSTNGSDFYLGVFGPLLSSLDYATYYGGMLSNEHVDGGTSRFDKRGVVYQAVCAGCGGSSDFPTTVGAWSRVNRSNNCNNAVFKIDLNVSSNPPVVRDTLIELFAGDTLDWIFTIREPDNDSLFADFSGSLFTLGPDTPKLEIQRTKTAMQVRLRWNTRCDQIGNDTFTLVVNARDNACLGINRKQANMRFVVLPLPAPITVYPQCLKTLTPNIVELKWRIPSQTKRFKSYEVYRSVAGNPYQLVSTLPRVTDSSWVDLAANNHLITNHCYYIITRNFCNDTANHSRTICSVYEATTNDSAFTFTRDTLLYVYATDTLIYSAQVQSISPQDSVLISLTSNAQTQSRIIATFAQDGLGAANYDFMFKGLCEDAVQQDTFLITLFIRNNQCPQSRTATARVRVVVLEPPVPATPDLQCVRSLGANTTFIRGNISNRSRYFSHYQLLRSVNGGSYTSIGKITDDSAFTFTDETAFNNQVADYCYAVIPVSICNRLGDTSAAECSIIKVVKYPAPIYLYEVSVVENKRVKLTWEVGNRSDFFKYKVLKSNLNANKFELIHATEGIDDTSFTDDAVDVATASYCYQIKQLNDCSVANDVNHTACTILLDGVSNPFIHQLQWNEYTYWNQGVSGYAIKRAGVGEQEGIIGSTTFTNTDYSDSKLNTDVGLYFYTIEASENNSIYKSVSNTIELFQKPLVMAPNAYTPNRDGLNDVWLPSSIFVKDYSLMIYNRWGQKVFETTNKKEGFSTAVLSNPETSDVFVYVITYTGWDGLVRSLKGNLTTLR